MKFRSGVIVALAAGLALGGCAAGAAGGGGGSLTSPTGKVYPPGTRPTQTRFSQAATLAIAQGNYEAAMASAQEGLAADTANPIHHYLAGDAAVGLGDFELADSLWREAERIYPAYEMEIEPSREAAWANAFNEGVDAYNAGNMAQAETAWRNADLIYRFRPEAAQNLAILLSGEGEYEDAIAMYRRGIESIDLRPATRVLEEAELAQRDTARTFMQESLATLLLYTDQFAEAETLLRQIIQVNPDNIEAQANLATALMRLERTDEATAIYTRLLSAPDLPLVELFGIGVALFNAEDYPRAAAAFGRVIERQPNHRDALFNQANALYAAESWAELIPVTERLLQIDPINENGYLILARGYRESTRNQDALSTLERLETLPVLLQDLTLQPGAETTRLTGGVKGNAATAGTSVRLRFTYYGDTGASMGTQDVTVTAPAREAVSPFQVQFQGQAGAYTYQVLP